MSVRTELRQRARSLRRTPSFRVPAAASLALGSGVGGALLAFSWSGLRRSDVPRGRIPVQGAGEEARSAVQLAAEGLDALLRVTEAAGLLLVIVLVVNLSLLTAARLAGRRRDLAIRVAIGTPPARHAIHLLADVATLVAAPLVMGIALAAAVLAAVRIGWPVALPVWWEARWLAYGLLAASLLPVSAVTLAALMQARRLGRADREGALQAELRTGAHATPGPHEGTVRQWLATFTVAASVALLIGAGTLLRAFAGPAGEHRHVSGIDPHDTLTFHLDLAASAAESAGERSNLQHSLLQRLTTIPGVLAASIASPGAWLGEGMEVPIRAYCGTCVRGTQWLPITNGPSRHHLVSPGFFRTHGIGVLHGREFAGSDDLDEPAVVVVDRTFANLYFPGAVPLGKEVQIGRRSTQRYVVVGVVESVASPSLGRRSEPVPTVYRTTVQDAPTTVGVAVRSIDSPAELDELLAAAVREFDPALVPFEIRPLVDRISEAAAPLRWFGRIFALAGVATSILAAFGIFGTLAHELTRRIPELGVRRALGARSRDVASVVLRRASRIVLPGLWLGSLAGIAIGRIFQVLFLGVRPVDPIVIGGVALGVLLTALAAAALPIRVATRVEPVATMRRN